VAFRDLNFGFNNRTRLAVTEVASGNDGSVFVGSPIEKRRMSMRSDLAYCVPGRGAAP